MAPNDATERSASLPEQAVDDATKGATSLAEQAVERIPALAGGVTRVGVDVVSIERFRTVLTNKGTQFEERVFQPVERDYCTGTAFQAEHYAARWAAKEAFIKTLDGDAVPMDAVGVEHSGDTPVLTLTDTATDALEASLSADAIDPETATIDTAVSLSHDRDSGTAMAVVLLLAHPQ